MCGNNKQGGVADDRVRNAWIPEWVSKSAFALRVCFWIDVTDSQGRAIRERRINNGRRGYKWE